MRTTRCISLVLDVASYITGSLLLLTWGLPTYAQQNNGLQKKILPAAANIRFDSLLLQITRHTGVRFSVNTRKFPPSKIIHVKKEWQSVSQLLEEIKTYTGSSYTLIGSHVVFVDQPLRQPIPVAVKPAGNPTPAVVKNKVLPVVSKTTIRSLPSMQPITRPDTPVLIISVADTIPILVKRRDSIPAFRDSVLAIGRRRDSVNRFWDSVLVIGRRRDSVNRFWDSVPVFGRRHTPRNTAGWEWSLPGWERDRWWSFTGNSDDTRYRGFAGLGYAHAGLTWPSFRFRGGFLSDSSRKHRMITFGSDTLHKEPVDAATASDQQQAAKKNNQALQQKPALKTTERKSIFAFLKRPEGGPYRHTTINTRGAWRKPFIKAGVAGSESFYVSPELQAGIPLLYGIINYSTNFQLSFVRYGAGTSIRLSDDWRLQLMATTGRMERSFDTAGIYDRKVKIELHKLAFMTEKKTNGPFVFQFGVSFNLMHTIYYRYGMLSAPYVSEWDADRKYHFFKPPYYIGPSYTGGDQRTIKMWLGIQAGVFYRLNLSKNR
ncbi:hypothetical protein [Chitinophaga nivalis]|uniref:DUF3575 domain-containing protein n=1 Tax=Chitinophaga nivalis TaxID=2991709 RepID=A0ABT3IM74_9BACT|nr:hypothetical protein [Chitinophaga nivalis]MCW3465241.1 hypothetical protein [Chitinophaga nivalis]MCW3485067.1 hypothetical protein [Chitinophaga nivalis]